MTKTLAVARLMEVLITTRLLLAASTLVLGVIPAHAQVKPGEPPITATTEASGGPIDSERAALRLEHVDLAIEIFPETQRLAGVATLTLATVAAQQRLLVDLDKNLPVSAISVDGKPLPRASWSNPEGRLAITLPAPLAAGGRSAVKITYSGTPHVAVRAPWDDGMVWSKTPDGKPWIATTAEGYGCDLFWPCLDFPAGEPARVDLHITVPKGLSAPSNGVLQKVDTLADGRTTWHWKARSPNPYSVVLNIAPYVEMKGSYSSRFGNTIPLYYWHIPGREAGANGLFAEFAPTLDFFEANVGPYPWGDEKLGVVETPHLGMEHQTINAYGNNYRKTPDGFDWLFQHELAHEWFGNQMSAANWDDYWLHEGYGQYMQPLYGRWREGEARYASMMEVFRNQIRNKAPIVSGRIMTEEEVYEEEKGGPGGDIYVKGAWVLHTLRNLIGDKAFWEVTRRLVYGRPDPKPGNFQPRFATTPEYVRIVNQVTSKDLTWFFDVYLREAALPELLQSREHGRLTLNWKAPGNKPFPLPVEVQVDGQVETVAMTGGTGSIAVPASAHVVVDPASRILKRSEAVEAAQRDSRGNE
ncbi:M1 family metallopeptidase [Sphingomonas psychrotolerans]|uniref:M1 family metallopeptidase n=1 Tax=Sphingomonas psychrotolerans TaxID=1327635 RepID=A0ABU3MYV8_9SPHN|nr:M1 family metallopeptidase [Sphingomonas psychrotolerans]MDT8757489.1 M1 family metallopeptidase [Sphingomonas psychrotolerans]